MTYSEELQKIEKRNRRIVRLRKNGWTYKKISDKFGISKQRVYAIITRENELSTGGVNKGLDKVNKI